LAGLQGAVAEKMLGVMVGDYCLQTSARSKARVAVDASTAAAHSTGACRPVAGRPPSQQAEPRTMLACGDAADTVRRAVVVKRARDGPEVLHARNRFVVAVDNGAGGRGRQSEVRQRQQGRARSEHQGGGC